MKNTQYTLHRDAGHGWLEVPIAELKLLGIANKITSFSHRRDDIAYLEITDDMAKFDCARGGKDSMRAPLVVRVVDDGYRSPIREYERFHLDLPADEADREAFEQAEWVEWFKRTVMEVSGIMGRELESLDELTGTLFDALRTERIVNDIIGHEVEYFDEITECLFDAFERHQQTIYADEQIV